MPGKKCPFCGKESFRCNQGEYRFEPPPNIPGGEFVIPDAIWHSCSDCGKEILPHTLIKAIELERCKRLGRLTPDEIREVRQKTGLSAVDLANLLGVGEKTYTRWENGHSLQNKANDTLIRLLDREAEVFSQLDAEREPDRQALISRYFQTLQNIEGQNPHAMAAHGGDLDADDAQNLQERLKHILAAQEDME